MHRSKRAVWAVTEPILNYGLAVLGTSLALKGEFAAKEKEEKFDVKQITKLLNNMDKTLQILVDEVKNQQHKKEYNEYAVEIDNLKFFLVNHLESPNNPVALDQFKQECEDNQMISFITWMEDQANRPGGSLYDVMVQGYDIRKMIAWEKLIMERMRQATIV